MDARLNIKDGGLDDSQKARLTTMLVDQRRMGVELPEVNTVLVERAENAPSLPVQDRADRLLRFIADQADRVSAPVRVGPDTHHAYAWSESTCWEDIAYLLDDLEKNGWIELQPAEREGRDVVVTGAGYRRTEEQQEGKES